MKTKKRKQEQQEITKSKHNNNNTNTMATLHLTAATTVADFRKEFNEAFGSQVKVYIGNKGADTSTTLSQAGLTKSGEMECANTMTVDTFIAACKNDWGLKVKVYTCDEWVAALDALTLEQSGQVKKAATKADMEKMVRTPAVEVPSTSVQTDAQPTIKIKNEEISNENIADLEKLINKDMVYVDSTILDTNCTYIMTKYYDASFHPNDDKRRKLVEWSDAKDMDVPLCLKCKIDEFLISKYLVSQKLWQLVMGNNPSSIIGDDYPVNNVSLIDAQSFVDKLNQMTDNRFHYAIPTEYQWEWAAKGGIFSHGYSFAGSDNLDEVSWYSGNSNKSLQKIGGKQPNELGLFDMSGLLLEWCSTRVEIKGSSKSADNCYDIQCYYHREEIKDGNLEINGNNTESNIERASTYAQRGGSYDSGTEKCKILHRSWGYSHVGHEWNGLRIISRVPENYERPVRQLVKQQENSKPTSNSESKGFIGNVLKKVFG